MPPIIPVASLAAEIANDPASLGYARATHAECAGTINAPSQDRVKSSCPVEAWRVLDWAATGTRMAAMEAAAAAGASAAKAALRMFDLFNASQFVDLRPLADRASPLVPAGVLSSADLTALRSLGPLSPASRAEELWGAGAFVSDDDVRRVRGEPERPPEPPPESPPDEGGGG